jgi:hypothetical protein
MDWIDRLESRVGWLAFPGLFRFFTLLGVLAFALSWMRPDLAQVLEFDRARVFSGEVWRVVTFPFAPGALRSFSLLAVVFLYCAVMIGFLINDSLESVWGVFRTSLFFYVGFFLLLLGNLFLPAMAWSGGLLYTSAFFAFATLFPRHQFMLFFILPVEVRFLAILSAVGLGFVAVSEPKLIPFLALALANYLIWAAVPALRDHKRLHEAGVRRRQFERAKAPEVVGFHECAVCGRTEHDDAQLEFRVARDGREYCTDHLPEDQS